MIGATRYTTSVEVSRQSKLSADIAKIQESISSNKRLSAPSDDPNAAARIADIRQDQADNAVWTRNTNTGASIASGADTALASLATAMTRAKELIISGANDTNANVDRSAIAAELRSIASQVTTLRASSDANGQPLFPSGDPVAIPVSPGLSITATASAKQVFDALPTDLGPKSIETILTDAATALELPADGTIAKTDANGDPVLDADGNPVLLKRSEAISAGVTAISSAGDHIAIERTDQGLRAQRFDDTKAAIAAGDTDLKVERSSLEDTDMTTALTDFQAKNLALQAAQTMFAQTHKSTLFDLLG